MRIIKLIVIVAIIGFLAYGFYPRIPDIGKICLTSEHSEKMGAFSFDKKRYENEGCPEEGYDESWRTYDFVFCDSFALLEDFVSNPSKYNFVKDNEEIDCYKVIVCYKDGKPVSAGIVNGYNLFYKFVNFYDGNYYKHVPLPLLELYYDKIEAYYWDGYFFCG